MKLKRIFSGEGVKNIFVISICINILCIATVFFLLYYANIQRTQKINEKISGIVYEVTKKYPNVSEEEIIKILNGNTKVEKTVLEKYGLTSSSPVIKEINSLESKNNIIILSTVSAFGIIYIFVYVLYKINEAKKISNINKYLTEINNRNYELKIEDNGENELSKLRNELYKTTVLLKESAINSEREKKKLSDSLADISHQLKTPLTSIRILLDNIEESQNMDEDTRKDFIKEIGEQVEHISSLVILLLKIAKLDSSSVKMENEKINIGKLIKEVIDSLAIIIELKNIKVEVNVKNSSYIYGDFKWQKEALTNIVKNAIEHSNENSKIQIIVEDTSVMLKIVVIDEGEGIDKEDQKHIFERFYKSKNASETSIGIGLSLAKLIIEGAGGYISVKSEKDKGTRFEIKYIK